MYKKFLLTLIFVFAFVFLASFLLPNFSRISFAEDVTQSDISVELNPNNPGANEDVTITVGSYLVNLDTYMITWLVDGKFEKADTGEKSFTIKTGGVGSKKTVSVTVKQGFTEITKTIVLSPSEVDLLWEANSYVPPFYKGLPLPTQEGTMNIVAIPNFKKKKFPNDAVFSWSKNDDPILESSGYKKNSLTYSLSYLRNDQSAAVTVNSVDGVESATKELKIFAVKPKIVFYERSPLLGLDLSKALAGSYSPNESQTSIFAVPYFFSTKDISEKNLAFSWVINGNNIPTPKIPNLLTVKPLSNESGIATINISASYLGKLFEDATNSLQLTLNQQ